MTLEQETALRRIMRAYRHVGSIPLEVLDSGVWLIALDARARKRHSPVLDVCDAVRLLRLDEALKRFQGRNSTGRIRHANSR